MIKKFSVFCLLFFAFSSSLNLNAAPIIYVGLTLDYVYTGIDATIDSEITSDSSTFWSLDLVMKSGPTVIVDLIMTVNKTELHHTYNYTQYEKATGSKLSAFQGFLLWINTEGLIIGENITVEGYSSKIIEIIDFTTPLGTFSVYNVTETHSSNINYYYYNVITGFLICLVNPVDDFSMYLNDSSSITEFPSFMLPLVLIVVPITIKFSKTLKNK